MGTEVVRKGRRRTSPAITKSLILDITEKLMLDEGYAAISTRRVAKEAGLNASLIHYYYPTTDDLFIALHRRMTEHHLSEMQRTFKNSDALRSLWRLQTTWAGAALAVEFIALANHRKSIKAEIARCSEQSRDLQAKELVPLLERAALDPRLYAPLGVATLLQGVARLLINESAIGISRGHKEARALVEWALRQIECKNRSN